MIFNRIFVLIENYLLEQNEFSTVHECVTIKDRNREHFFLQSMKSLTVCECVLNRKEIAHIQKASSTLLHTYMCTHTHLTSVEKWELFKSNLFFILHCWNDDDDAWLAHNKVVQIRSAFDYLCMPLRVREGGSWKMGVGQQTIRPSMKLHQLWKLRWIKLALSLVPACLPACQPLAAYLFFLNSSSLCSSPTSLLYSLYKMMTKWRRLKHTVTKFIIF